MGDGHLVAGVQNHCQGIFGGGGRKDAFLFQTDEVIQVLPSSTAERISATEPEAVVWGSSSGWVTPLSDSIRIFLLALGDGAAGGHDVVPGHVDHGVALDQVGIVLEGMK